MTDTAVVGAGIVGICTAIALADRGHMVTLIDRGAPAQETSRWNAGVLATSSVIPLNNPSLFANLPRLVTGRHPGFRLNMSQSVALLPWAVRFLANSRAKPSGHCAAALSALISYSRQCHETICARSGFSGLSRDGWFMVFRGSSGSARAKVQASLLQNHKVEAREISIAELRQMEPHIAPVFSGGVHIEHSASTDPAALCAAYLAFAQELGVKLVRAEIQAVCREGTVLGLVGANGHLGAFDRVVLTLGPWSNTVLKSLGKPLPMAIERGYLRSYASDTAPSRPFFDVDCGYVAAARPGGVQISSGTELTRLPARPNPSNFECALGAAKDALSLGAPLTSSVAIGNRPTLPDSLPVIGRLQSMPGVWIAAGHQHVGFSTSAGTASLLTTLMENEPPEIDPEPFIPSRFGL